MKYIGQYVYDLIARFRGDVYINSDLYLQQAHTVISGGYDGGTSSQDRILYLDPNGTGKVTHSSDFEYDTDNETLRIGDTDSGYATIKRNNRNTQDASGGHLALEAGKGTGTATGGLIYLGTSKAGSISGFSTNDITEKLILWPNVDVSGFAGSGSAGGHNSDFVQVTMPGGLGVYTDTNPKVVLGPATTAASPSGIGVIEWHGMNTNSELIDFVMLSGGASDNTDGDEAGSLSIKVAASTGSFSSLKTGLQVNGSNADNDVDIVLGSASTSTTTINGFLSLGGHAVDDIDIGSENSNSDEHLMTSAAINARITAATTGTSVDLTSEVSGILPVANGGTGASSLTDNSILTGTGTSAITAEANLTWDGSMLTVFSDGDANEPVIKIHARDDTAPLTGGELRFDSDRGDTGLGNSNDVLGTITWRGHDDQTGGGATESTFASIVGTATDANNNSEDGKLDFNVLNQGTMNSGLSLTAGGINGHVNATIGKGTAGVVTIEGHLNLGGHNVNDIDLAGEFVDSDNHLMTSAAINDRIAAVGGSVSVSNSTSDTDFPIVFHDESNNLHDDTGSFTYNPSDQSLNLVSATSNFPTITLANSNTDANPPVFTFQKTATGADGDDLGRIDFKGDDGSNNVETFAQILGEIAEADHGSEEGKLTLSVASHDAEMQPGLIIASGNAEDEVDVTLGNGATSLTTIAGNKARFQSSDDMAIQAVDNIGGGAQFIMQAGGSNNTSVGLYTTAAAHLNLNSDGDGILSGTNLVGKNVNITTGRGTGTSRAGNIYLGIYPTHTVSGTGKSTDDPVYHQFGHDAIDLFAYATATTGSLVTIHSNDTTVGNGGELQFKKNAADTEDGEVLGKVTFYGEDEGNNNTQFAEIIGSISESDEGDEAGKLEFKVATSDSSTSALQQALTATGNATNNRVDISLGYGATSTVTVVAKATVLDVLTAGGLSLGGHAVDDIQVAGDTFADVDDQLMSAAAINDLIGAVGGGGSVSVSDSTANTNFPVVFHDESNNLHDDTGAFTYNPSTGTANIPIASIPKRKFAIPADGAGNADGDIVYIGTGSTVVGKIYYYKSDGSWGLTNSDDPSTATGWLAVALGTDPDADGMLLRGTIDLAENIVGTEALGSIIYLDKATAGAATTAAPTATGDIVRVIGYALTTGDANKIWFSPDNTWVEHV